MPIDFSKKKAGLLVPVFALRRTDDLGIGDTQAVKETIDFCKGVGVGVLQLLPINETGGDNSPYNAVSALALDPVYITMTPEQVPGLDPAHLAQIATPDVLGRVRPGPVNYSLVKPLKRKLLEAAYEGFLSGGDNQSRKAFDTFKNEHKDWLGDYSLFSLLLEIYQGDARWPQWHLNHVCSSATRKWIAANKDKAALEKRADFFAYVQWVAFTQWLEIRAYADKNGVQLMGDIPFGVSRYSADVWGNPKIFDLDWSGGAPPETFFKCDPFTEKWGQNWGIPLYHWKENEAEDFAWWKKRVRLTCKVFNLFRIDHVLGFFRIYSFPWTPEKNGEFMNLTLEQAKEKTGGLLPGFLQYPDEPVDLAVKNSIQGYRLLDKIKQFAAEEGVVAEDLGVVPSYVKPILEELAIPGFTIPIFVRDEETREFLSPSDYPEKTLITFATHDHPPMASYYADIVARWKGPGGHEAWLDIERLMRLLGLALGREGQPPAEFNPLIHEAMMKLILDNHCWLAVFMITDLLGNTQRFNEPGLSADSNWSQRLDFSLGELKAHPTYSAVVEQFALMVKASGRAG